MKLKKIASLALAGIMAVSMLAGCNGASSSNPTEPENPVVPNGTNIAGYVNGLLSEDVSENIKFVDDAELRAALTEVAGKSSNINSTDIKTKNSTIDVANGCNQSLVGKVKEEFTSGMIETNSISKWVNKAPTTNDGVDYYLEVYLLDGDMTEMNVATAVYNGYSTWLAAMTNTSVSGKKCDWSGDVSAVKVYDNTDPDTSAWFVGIMFTKTVSDITNTVK